MTPFGVVLFHTTSAAMQAEKTLAGAGLDVRPIPTPREFSSDCGIALRFMWDDAARVRGSLEAAGVETAGVHELG